MLQILEGTSKTWNQLSRKVEVNSWDTKCGRMQSEGVEFLLLQVGQSRE